MAGLGSHTDSSVGGRFKRAAYHRACSAAAPRNSGPARRAGALAAASLTAGVGSELHLGGEVELRQLGSEGILGEIREAILPMKKGQTAIKRK